MNMERVDRVVFRFSVNELGALLKLMGLPALPDTSAAPADPKRGTVESLVESGAVMACGGRTFVDGTIRMVLQNAARSLGRLTAAGKAGTAVLYRGERMYVLAEERGELVSLEPLQDLQAAREPFLTAADRLGADMRALLARADDAQDEGAGPQTVRAFLDRMET